MKLWLWLWVGISLCGDLGAQKRSSESSVGPMLLSQIRIRDPYILTDSQSCAYYLFRTNRSDGFDCYKSKDLRVWYGPTPLFRAEADFWGEKDFWAPECHPYRGHYLLFATLRHKRDSMIGTTLFISDRPDGAYHPCSEGRITPEGWNALDGTLYIDRKGKPWMVFCHEWTQVDDGTIEAVRLKKNMSGTQGEPTTLFSGSEAPWAVPFIPNQTKFVTDGPFLFRNHKEELWMIWSSFGTQGYAVGVARSLSNEILGPWVQEPEPLFRQNGGHGMLFRTLEGELVLCIHQPNDAPMERTALFKIEETPEGRLKLGEPLH
ncbi:MAG: glycoside hydrolase family 43 protein [Alistipes sp.]|nr:glycoside hydrolase family 43 protein [Alistipes sp.]